MSAARKKERKERDGGSLPVSLLFSSPLLLYKGQPYLSPSISLSLSFDMEDNGYGIFDCWLLARGSVQYGACATDALQSTSPSHR